MKGLDIFCGGGGASMGLFRAGIDVTGVDIVDQPEYPFKFICQDAMTVDLSGYDFFWASPPCQRWTLALRPKQRERHPDLIDPVRQRLLRTGKPFVIENVVRAPLRRDLMLCGEMFQLKVIRHRIFEIHGFKVLQLKHPKHRGSIRDGHYVSVVGSGGVWNSRMKHPLRIRGVGKVLKWVDIWKFAMNISWINNQKTLAQCVPPSYSLYIANAFLNQSS